MAGGLATRRTVVAGALLGGLAAAAGLSGCGGKSTSLPPEPVPEPTPDPDTELLAEVLAAKRALLARYVATADRFPALSTGLAAARGDHEGHVRALAANPLAPPGAAGAVPASPSPGASPSPTGPAVPGDRAAAVRALAAAERDAAEERLTQCLAARDAGLARLLASLGACEAAHALVISDLAGVAGS